MRALLLAALALGTTAQAQPNANRQLPFPTIQALCDKFKDQPAFERQGEVTRISCPTVYRFGEIDRETLVEIYRRLMTGAGSLDKLRTLPNLPEDLVCPPGATQRGNAELLLDCRSQLGTENTAFRFYANAQGMLTRLETSLNFAKVYRAGMQRAQQRGSVSRFHEAYVQLQTELMFEKLKFTAAPQDSVTLKDGTISLVLRLAR